MTTPAPKSRRLALLLAVAAVLAGGGVLVSRWSSRYAERREALALAETKPADALPTLRRLLDRAPDDAELLGAVVRTMTRNAAPVADTEPFLERWCRAAPDDPAPFRFRHDLMKRAARNDEAVTAAQKVLSLAPDDHGTRHSLAGVLLKLGRFDEAAAEFQRLLESSPLPKGELKVGLARAAFERGDTAAAGRLLDEAIAETPMSTPALILRGMTHHKAGEFDRAVAVLVRARVESQHEKEIVLYHLALSFHQLGKADDAKKAEAMLAASQKARAFREDAAQRPDDVPLQLRAAEALLAAEQASVARGDLEAALGRLGPNKPILLALAQCYDKLGEPARAKSARDRAAQVP